MQWPIILCVLLASAAVSATSDENRSKRDLNFLKNLIASSIFGIQQNKSVQSPILVQEDGNTKIYQIPGMDNLLVRTVPKKTYRIDEVIPEPVEPIVEAPIQALKTYLGTKTNDETLLALHSIRNLLASGTLVASKPFMPIKPHKIPLIPVIPPSKPVPIVEEVIPMRPLDYPEVIAIDVPNQYSYKQEKSDGSMTKYTSKNGGDVIVTHSRQPMPLPPPYIMERLKQVCVQPIPVRPLLQPIPIPAPRPVPYNIPFIQFPPAMPVITELSNVNVKPFSIREEINVGPLMKETDFVVSEPIMLPPMPPRLLLNKDVSGISPLFRPHQAFIGPVPIGSYSPPHFYKGPHVFEPFRPTNTKGEVQVQRFGNKKGHTFLGMHHQIPVRNSHHAAILEKPVRMPVPPGPITQRLENVVALANAVHPPKASPGYSFKIGSVYKNVSTNIDGSTVKNDIKSIKSNTLPHSSSFSYKQISSDGVTTFTENEVNTDSVNPINELYTVPVVANQVMVERESIKEEKPKEVVLTSPVSSSYIYKQVNQHGAEVLVNPVQVENKINESPKASPGYSFKIGSVFANVSTNIDGTTVKNDIKSITPNNLPQSSSFSYKQISSDGVTTFTENQVNIDSVNLINGLNTVPVLANQVGVERESVKEEIPKATVVLTTPVSSSYIYKQLNQDGSEYLVNPVHLEKKIEESRKPADFAYLRPVGVMSESMKEEQPKVVRVTSPVSSPYVYKQLYQDGSPHIKDREYHVNTEQVYTHEHILADGSKQPCSEVHVNPIHVEKKIESRKPANLVYIPPHMDEIPVSSMMPNRFSLSTSIPSEVKMPTVPILKIDSEKLNVTSNFSYRQLTDKGMLTNVNGNVEVKEFISNSPKGVETSRTVTAIEGSLASNPIVVVDESYYATKDKRESSTSSGKNKSENVVSDETSDSSRTGHEKHMRGDIPDAMS